ncbi:transcriptional Coactivator p15-domain-containing protein [Russula emetica]|nr:transcriptional Coactivator p15-domain-containing protein [Russula emetica]
MAKSTSKNGGSKRSSKSREPSEQNSKGSSKRKATEKGDSDNDDDAQLSEEAQRPPIKTVKTVKKPRISSKSDEDDTDSEDAETKFQMNSEGEMYADLGKKKRVTVRSFKGNTLVDIREYYGAEGDEKPGKKGISLTVEQWKSLMEVSGDICDLL